jgi:hypothetical protein
MKRATLVCLLAGLLPTTTLGQNRKVPPILSLEARQPAPDDGKLRRLLIERRNAAVAEMRILAKDYGEPAAPEENGLTDAVYRVVVSELDLVDGQAEQVAILEGYVEFLRGVERLVEQKVRAQTSTRLALERARYQRLDAEIWLYRTRQPAEKKKP